MPIDLFVQIDLFVDSMSGGWLDAATEAACAMVDLDNFATGAKATSTGLFFSLHRACTFFNRDGCRLNKPGWFRLSRDGFWPQNRYFEAETSTGMHPGSTGMSWLPGPAEKNTSASRDVNRNGASEFFVLSRDVGLHMGPGVARAGVTIFHLLALSVSLTVAPSLTVALSLSLSLSLSLAHRAGNKLLLIITTTANIDVLAFARLVALAAQRAGVAPFANHLTFTCTTFNDEGARAQFSSYSTHLSLHCRNSSTFEKATRGLQ
jgi:hypothetical protein